MSTARAAGLSYCWIDASARSARSRFIGTASRNFRMMFAPPAKSMPQFTPFLMKSTPPMIAKITEKATAWKRHLTKSYLVLTKICMTVFLDLNADRLRLLRCRVFEIEDHARHEKRGEHGGEEADEQRDGESLDRSRSELEEEQRRDDGRHVRVDDGAEGALESLLDRGANGLPFAQLLADALEHEHVRVHGHAERQDDAGDAGQRERRLEVRQHSETEDEVEQKREHRVDARAFVVDQDA